MATRKEYLLGTVIGSGVGALAGYYLSKKQSLDPQRQLNNVLLGAFLGGVAGALTAIIVGSKCDTVNYELYNGRKRVYHGITYYSRINSRQREHISSGKIFNRIVVDAPKPRKEALALEKKLIRRDRPFYNIQHNQY